MLNVKSEISSVEVLNGQEVLFSRIANNVEFAPLFSLGLENRFDIANEILEISDYTYGIDSEFAYNTRVHCEMVGTYKIEVTSKLGYEEFMKLLKNEKELTKEAYKRLLVTYRGHLMHFMSIGDSERSQEFEDAIKDIRERIQKDKDLNFTVSFDEWNNNKMSNNAKLSKLLAKRFNGRMLDFYTSQKRNVPCETYYFTITNLVQHIAGMSYFSNGNWNGMNGSSCMNPENHYSEVVRLGGALHDDKLFVGFLHADLSDLEDMEGKALARTCLRLVTPKKDLVDDILKIDKNLLIATNYYCDNSGIIENIMLQLQSLNIGILSNNVIVGNNFEGRKVVIEEKANGAYMHIMSDEIEVNECIDEYVTVDCPLCNGSGTYEVYSHRHDKDFTVDCPACNGSGEYEAYMSIEVNEYVEVEDEMDIIPYNEGYKHYGQKTTIAVKYDYFTEVVGK